MLVTGIKKYISLGTRRVVVHNDVINALYAVCFHKRKSFFAPQIGHEPHPFATCWVGRNVRQ